MNNMKYCEFASNSFGKNFKFLGKPVYFLPRRHQDKDNFKDSKLFFLSSKVKEGKMNKVLKCMRDWKLHDNKWIVTKSNNVSLFFYLCGIDNDDKPNVLDFFI